MKELFNTLPRSTFRWLKVNHTDGSIWQVSQNYGKVSVAGSAIITDLEDKKMLSSSYAGVSVARLEDVANHYETGLRVKVEAGKKETLALGFPLDDNHSAQKVRVQIQLEEGAQLDVLYHCEDELSTEGVLELFTEISVGKDAVLNFVKVQLYSNQVQQFEHRYLQIGENGKVDFVNVELGGLENYLNFESCLQGDHSEFYHDLAYLGKGEQRFDVAMLMAHEGKHSICDVHHLGALGQNAKKSFRGTLDFKHGSTHSEGAEEDICLLLDPTVKSVSLPLLLCKEDDVSGNHAASAGQIDQNKLFYLMSRGFNAEEAKHIIVESMLRPIIDKIGNEELEEKALTLLSNKI